MKYTIYIKLTNACNLRCKHCYNEMMNNKQYMNRETLESSITAIRNFSDENPSDTIDLQIHGGEPLLYDIEGIHELVNSLRTDKIRFGITTNLVHRGLTQRHMDLFRNICPDGITPFITTSWDKDIRFGDAEEYIWKSNVTKLIENEIHVQPIVCVTNILTRTKPHTLFSYMKELGVADLNFERITLSGRAKDGILKPSNREVDDWLLEAYLENENYRFNVPMFDSIEKSINGFFLGCRARMCMRTVITINPDGTLSACPNTANYTTGIISNGRFSFYDNPLKKLIDAEKHIDDNCLVCKYFKYCNCDCCQLRFDETGCPGLKGIYGYLTDQKSS